MDQTSAPLMSPLSPGASIDDILLADESGNIKYKGSSCTIIMTAQTLNFRHTTKASKSFGEFPISAIIGSALKSKKYYKDTHFYIEIYMYIVANGCCFSAVKNGNRRKRQVIKLEFGSNESLCRRWTNAINSASSGCIPLLVADNGVDILPPPKQRHFLVFVNPVSGKGLGIKIWQKDVRPLLEEAEIKIQLCITQYANHAKTMLLDHDLSVYDAVLIVGGDGLIFEVINGIAARADSGVIFKTLPVVPIPGGTANGLVKSVLFECHEEYSAMNATFVALKGTPHPVDLSKVVTCSGTVYYSFLILGWGLISDIDILSETMRCIGELRLYIAAVYFIMKKRKYKGRLTMHLANVDNSGELTPPKSPQEQQIVSPYQYSHDIESRESLDSSTRWVTIEGDFVLVWVVQTSHATASMYSGPGASLADGVFTIFVVRDMSRFELLQMLIGADNGEHIHHPKVKTYKALSYTLEPLTEKGIFTLDGEVVEYGKLEATMLPGQMQVLKTSSSA